MCRADPADPSGRAAFLDQTSLLKKYFGSVLYLDIQRDKRDGWAEHVALALAAALAMIWAIGLQIFTFFALGLDLTQNMGLGFLLIFSMIAVIGYILKDRIKATVECPPQKNPAVVERSTESSVRSRWGPGVRTHRGTHAICTT